MTLGSITFKWLMAALGIMLGQGLACAASNSSKSSKAEKIDFARDVQPLLARYCYGCHGEKKKGDLDLRLYMDERTVARNRQVFEKVVKNLQAHEMPPENKPQPSPAERELITAWAGSFLFECDCEHPDPGRVTIRRLNRAEYNNTIRDLAGVDFQPAADFPEDDSGYGFDNIGDVLSLSPVLLEKYLAAAEKILDKVMQSADSIILVCQPSAATKRECARDIIIHFAARAFRRPVSDEEIGRVLALFESADAQGETFPRAMKPALAAVLISPHFLFRGETQAQPDNPSVASAIDEYALASRLSYFLWSSMPDAELFREAEGRTLRRHLEAQIRRMARDAKAQAFVQNFSGQWLQLRNLKLVAPDAKLFGDFDDKLRASMLKETELFFEFILREDRSLLELIDADYSFLNERLARLYGIAGVSGKDFRRVSLRGTNRGGLLSQASILTLTSNPTRTSPVKRGKWVLENILGAPPPPPPPNVPELKESKEAALTGSLRQRMEQHRANPSCASCHARMDPIGFGFENFNAIGAWRETDGDFPINASGKLLTGEAFNGPAELKDVLLNQKREEFVRCLAEKVLTYALGRGMEYYDKCAIEKIVKNVAKEQYRFSALILEVVKSTPFQMRRGETVQLKGKT